MSFWIRGNIRRVIGGVWLSRGRDPETSGDRVLDGLSIDSRTIKRGQAFLALRGDRFDGHQFLQTAVGSGAALLIIDDDAAGKACVAQLKPTDDVCILRVPDTAKALLKLAAAYRRSLERTRVVGVVGSNGKTTTARLIATVLAGGGLRGTASPKSFNNAVGVPLTILSAAPADQYLICEIGTNAPGEIAQLAEVVRPDVIVMTSIGREHLEGFGSLEGVAREEGAVLAHAADAALVIAPATFPAGAESLDDQLRTLPNVVRFGRGGVTNANQNADLRAEDVRHQSGRLTFSVNGRVPISMALLGEHNALNGLAAFAVGRRFGVDEAKIATALAGAAGPPMRLEPVRVTLLGSDAVLPSGTTPGSPTPELTFINDAYNANPDSMLASLATFESIMRDWPGVSRRVLALGDMLELGDASEPSHREIGRRVGSMSGIDLILLLGPLMTHAADEIRLLGRGDRLVHLPDLLDPSIAALAAHLRPGDLALLKGSRGTRLERIIQARRDATPAIPATAVVAPRAADRCV